MAKAKAEKPVVKAEALVEVEVLTPIKSGDAVQKRGAIVMIPASEAAELAKGGAVKLTEPAKDEVAAPAVQPTVPADDKAEKPGQRERH
jgi:hypothetical protein